MRDTNGPLFFGIALPILNFVLVMRMIYEMLPVVWTTIVIGCLLGFVVFAVYIGAILDDPRVEKVIPSVFVLILLLILQPHMEQAEQRSRAAALQKAVIRKTNLALGKVPLIVQNAQRHTARLKTHP